MAKKNEPHDLRVVRLQAENFKRLSAVDITPPPGEDVVVISGPNAAGKSSVLDAIMAALAHGRELPDMPLRKDAEDGRVELDLGEFIVERTFHREGDEVKSEITVKARDGARYPSPQKVLEGFLGRLALDPMAFYRMDAKGQAQEVFRLAAPDLDPEELAAKRRGFAEERTVRERVRRQAEARLKGMAAAPADAPAEEVDVSELGRKVQAINERNLRRRSMKAQVTQLLGQIDRLQEQLKIAEAELAKVGEEEEPTAELEAAVAAASEVNAKVNAARNRQLAITEYGKAENAVAEMDAKIKELDAHRAACLAAAKLPVEGLAFGEEGLVLRGVPLAQCAASERLRTALAFSMAVNPVVRVVLVRDASLLDEEGLAVIREMAAARGYQVWLECVDSRGGLGFVIHEGRVVATPAKGGA